MSRGSNNPNVIPVDTLMDTFTYDSINGGLIRILGRAYKKRHTKSYHMVWFSNKLYLEHRLVFLYHNPDMDQSMQIDHINGTPTDNRIENLRLVSNQGNHFNETRAVGCSYIVHLKKWRAYIVRDNKQIGLGLYETILDARAAYLRAKKKYHVIEER